MQVDVPTMAFRTGALLEFGRCARHDAPATGSRSRRFTTDPPAAAVLLLFVTFFLALLVLGAIQKDVSGPLPECDRCRRTRRRRVTAMWTSIAGAVASLAAFFLSADPAVGFLGLALLLTAIVLGVVAGVARVRGMLTSDLGWVRLSGVDRAFAAAVQHRIRVAPQPDPWVTPLR